MQGEHRRAGRYTDYFLKYTAPTTRFVAGAEQVDERLVKRFAGTGLILLDATAASLHLTPTQAPIGSVRLRGTLSGPCCLLPSRLFLLR